MQGWIFGIAAGLATLAGCATTDHRPAPAEPRGESQCNADGAQDFIGQKATGEIGRQMLSTTGARQLRWVPPRTAVTMDFRADRLTVSYDDHMMIERVSCG